MCNFVEVVRLDFTKQKERSHSACLHERCTSVNVESSLDQEIRHTIIRTYYMYLWVAPSCPSLRVPLSMWTEDLDLVEGRNKRTASAAGSCFRARPWTERKVDEGQTILKSYQRPNFWPIVPPVRWPAEGAKSKTHVSYWFYLKSFSLFPLARNVRAKHLCHPALDCSVPRRE